MKNHKECFQRYGVRRPLKLRRRRAREQRRIAAGMKADYLRIKGGHEIWWEAGQGLLAWEEFERSERDQQFHDDGEGNKHSGARGDCGRCQ